MTDTAHCSFAGLGRGDCERFIGLPGTSIPGEHDGPDDTVDVYGKPNGWCWFCWHSLQIQRLRTENKQLRDWAKNHLREMREVLGSDEAQHVC